VDHVHDLTADFRAIYHMSMADAQEELDAPEFLSMCLRLMAYTGVIAARMQAASEKQNPASAGQPVTGQVDTVGSTRGELVASPIGDLFEFSEG
jgi:hypothetical protein